MKKNEAQEQCICTINGQVIVIACPGAGKTTTLLARIRHMVEEGVDPKTILMMTFTRAAANEMKKRYESEPGSKKGVTFCTIHALCLSILSWFGERPEILSESESKDFFFSVLRDCASKRPSMDIRKEFRQKIGSVSDRSQFIDDLFLDISVRKNNPGREFKLNSTKDKALFQYLWDLYEDYKTQQNKIDFDDMLTKTYELLLNNRQALQMMREKFRYIQVDEYQDTNYIQRDIIYLIAGENGNLAVVGDDDQSIYGFRGARPEIMLSFPMDYPDAKIIKMGTNYRSAQKIIKCSGKMINKNKKRYEKEFIAAKKDDGEIELTIGDTKSEEHNILAGRIKNLLDAGKSDKEIAVLYRTNKEAEAIANGLSRLGIEFQVADGISNRYEHWIKHDIFAYYRLANGLGDKGDLYRALNHPQRYLANPKYLQFKGDKFSPSKENEQAMRLAAYEGSEEFWKIKGAVKNIEDFFRLLRRLQGKDPKAFLNILFRTYKEYLCSYADFRGMDLEDLTNVWDDYLKDVSSLGETCTWKDWEEYIRRYGFTIQQARKSQKGVMLSSMHKSKGLEWEYVFIMNCVDGNIPFFSDKAMCDREEERRLFYVACTRAKKHLELLCYKKKGTKPVNISPFVKELAEP